MLFFGCGCAFGAFGCAMWPCVQLVNLVHLVSEGCCLWVEQKNMMTSLNTPTQKSFDTP